MQLLANTHISSETAYVVEDYPYGFRLRCRMRYWLEVHPKRGVRLMSQTSNPKKPGLVWNKPKASTYARFGGALYLDDEGHVQWADWVEVKLIYDELVAGGMDWRAAGAVAAIEYAKAKKENEA